MKILVEGQSYNLSELATLIDNSQFYKTDGKLGVINHVGFCHSLDTKEVIYFLPKVFVINNKLFGEFDIKDNTPFTPDEIPHLTNNSWLGKLLLLFFQGITEYKRRNPKSKIIERGNYFELSSNLGDTEYSYLDICLGIISYYKSEKEKILFRNAKRKSSIVRKMNWKRTINQQTPIIDSNNTPIYTILESKKKHVDNEESLLIIFYSILNNISQELGQNINLTVNYQLYTGSKFSWLEKNGTRLLKKIKYKYFSDDLKKIYNLCLLYLDKKYSGNLNRKKEEFIAIRDYNIVFEDMVDKLFTDDSLLNYANREVSISDLKNNLDGKIIDHIFKFDSIIDDSEILYIGDSKYYKPDAKAGKISIYKQFTYAKNIVQFNIDLLNNPKSSEIPGVRYYDNKTEGYNITPNFLLYAFIPEDEGNMILDYKTHSLEYYTEDIKPKCSFHFSERLFDRDTLFVHEYKINFLFVLHSYCTKSISNLLAFRNETKIYFRDRLKSYFKDNQMSGFEFRLKRFETPEELQDYINLNFRILIGKVISIDNQTLLLAKNINYSQSDSEFNELSKEFNIPFNWD
uniref:hypothetical protein n=1 Tax=Flavobacterium sp. TaxID=239 RepID=UPI00404B0451